VPCSVGWPRPEVLEEAAVLCLEKQGCAEWVLLENKFVETGGVENTLYYWLVCFQAGSFPPRCVIIINKNLKFDANGGHRSLNIDDNAIHVGILCSSPFCPNSSVTYAYRCHSSCLVTEMSRVGFCHLGSPVEEACFPREVSLLPTQIPR